MQQMVIKHLSAVCALAAWFAVMLVFFERLTR